MKAKICHISDITRKICRLESIQLAYERIDIEKMHLVNQTFVPDPSESLLHVYQ